MVPKVPFILGRLSFCRLVPPHPLVYVGNLVGIKMAPNEFGAKGAISLLFKSPGSIRLTAELRLV